MTTLRQTVSSMPPDERLEYVLYCWESMTGQDDAPPRTVGGVPLSPSQATVFALLNRRVGQPVSIGALMAVLDANKADAETTPDMVHAHICHVRKKLVDQFRVRTVWGHGYVLEADVDARRS